MQRLYVLPLGVGDLVKVVGGLYSGHMGFVKCVDYDPDISIVELQSKRVLYFSLEKLLSTDSLHS